MSYNQNNLTPFPFGYWYSPASRQYIPIYPFGSGVSTSENTVSTSLGFSNVDFHGAPPGFQFPLPSGLQVPQGVQHPPGIAIPVPPAAEHPVRSVIQHTNDHRAPLAPIAEEEPQVGLVDVELEVAATQLVHLEQQEALDLTVGQRGVIAEIDAECEAVAARNLAFDEVVREVVDMEVEPVLPPRFSIEHLLAPVQQQVQVVNQHVEAPVQQVQLQTPHAQEPMVVDLTGTPPIVDLTVTPTPPLVDLTGDDEIAPFPVYGPHVCDNLGYYAMQGDIDVVALTRETDLTEISTLLANENSIDTDAYLRGIQASPQDLPQEQPSSPEVVQVGGGRKKKADEQQSSDQTEHRYNLRNLLKRIHSEPVPGPSAKKARTQPPKGKKQLTKQQVRKRKEDGPLSYGVWKKKEEEKKRQQGQKEAAERREGAKTLREFMETDRDLDERLAEFELRDRAREEAALMKKPTEELTDDDIFELHVEETQAPVAWKYKNLPGTAYKTKLRIVNMENAPDPTERMKIIFTEIIERAMDEGEKRMGTRPKSFAMVIESPAYEKAHERKWHGPIAIYRQNFTMNSYDEINREFNRVENSAGALDLVGFPIDIQVDVFDTIAVRKKDRIAGGGAKESAIKTWMQKRFSGKVIKTAFKRTGPIRGAGAYISSDEEENQPSTSAASRPLVHRPYTKPTDRRPRHPLSVRDLILDQAAVGREESDDEDLSGCEEDSDAVSSDEEEDDNEDDDVEGLIDNNPVEEEEPGFYRQVDEEMNQEAQSEQEYDQSVEQEMEVEDEDEEPPIEPQEPDTVFKHGVITLLNHDRLCLFRSIVIARHFNSKTIRTARGNERAFIDDNHKFAMYFYHYVRSQLKPLRATEKRELIKEAKKKLKGSGVVVSASKNKNPDTELIRAKETLDERGIPFDVPFFSKKADRVYAEVKEMMEALDIPMNLADYDIEDWGNIIQSYLNERYGDSTYQIVLLGDKNGIRSTIPIWEANVTKPLIATPLFICYSGRHFEPIAYPGPFFATRYYCHYCRLPYQTRETHSTSCKKKCPKCACGTRPECEELEIYYKELEENGTPVDTLYKKQCLKRPDGVDGCYKFFYSQQCYDAHLRKMCRLYMQCPKCLKEDRNDGQHVCGQYRCRYCEQRHPPGTKNCYLKKKEIKEDQKPTRHVIYDIESRLEGGPYQCECGSRNGTKCPVDVEPVIATYLSQMDELRKTSNIEEFKTDPHKRLTDARLDRMTDHVAEGRGFMRAENEDEWQSIRRMLAVRYTIGARYFECNFREEDVAFFVELFVPYLPAETDADVPGNSAELDERQQKRASLMHQVRTQLTARGFYTTDPDARSYPTPIFIEAPEAREVQREEVVVNDIGLQRKKKCSGVSAEYGANRVDASNHECVMLVAKVVCDRCIEDKSWLKDENNGCDVCFGGPDGKVDPNITSRWHKWSAAEKNAPARPNKPIYTETPAHDFIRYLLEETNPNYKTKTHSHNGGRYDIILAARVAYQIENLKVDMTARGNRIYSMKLKKGMYMKKRITKTEFRDSLNILGLPLSKLVATFDLKKDGVPMESKGDFPFELIQPQNYDKTFDHHPSMAHYKVNWKAGEWQAFVKKYEENKHKKFVFATEIDDYCTNDVEILTHALVEYRELMLEVTKPVKIDILRDSLTIASHAMNHFRANYLSKAPPKSFPRVPPRGYFTNDRQSTIARKYLKWIAKKNNYNMEEFKFAENREHWWEDTQIGKIKVDGYYEEQTRWTRKELMDMADAAFPTSFIDDSKQYKEMLRKRDAEYVRLVEEYQAEDKLTENPKHIMKKTIYEVHGCLFHACPKCFPSEVWGHQKHPLKKKLTFDEIKAHSDVREECIRAYLADNPDNEFHVIYECEINKKLGKKSDITCNGRKPEKRKKADRDEEMIEFFKNCIDTVPFTPRLALKGGRTVAHACDVDADDEHDIGYVDFDSLYPSINYEADYARGHPDAKSWYKTLKDPADNFFLEQHELYWTKPEHIVDLNNPYIRIDDKLPMSPSNRKPNLIRGIFQLEMLADPSTLIPTVAIRFDERMLFVNCLACAKLFDSSMEMTTTSMVEKMTGQHINSVKEICRKLGHTDKDRAFTVIIDSDELEHALRNGYKVTKVFNGLVWPEKDGEGRDVWSRDLFKEYVRDFVKLKVESSGWPPLVKGDPIKEDVYIQKYHDIYGIDIDRSKLATVNSGLRYVAKLFLNSMWGRFGLKNNLEKHEVITCMEEGRRITEDQSNAVGTSVELGNGKTLVVYKKKAGYEESHNSASIFMSARTTAMARLKLLRAMEKIMKYKGYGAKILYTDTDSIIFRYPRRMKQEIWDDLGIDDILGTLKDEKPNHNILSFVCGGSKQYFLKLEHKETKEISYERKLRGICQDIHSEKSIQFEEFRKMVRNFGKEKPKNLWQHTFMPCVKDGTVHTKRVLKQYNVIMTKMLVDNKSKHYDCYPFGYREVEDDFYDDDAFMV